MKMKRAYQGKNFHFFKGENNELKITDPTTGEELMFFIDDDHEDSLVEAYFQGYSKGVKGGRESVRKEILLILGIDNEGKPIQ